MVPVLLNLKFLKLYTFGVFLVLAFFWGSFLLWKNFLLTAYKEEEIFDGVFWALFGGLFLARVFYVAFHFGEFGLDFLKFILINGYPGLSLWGFIVGFIGSLFLYFASKKAKFSEVIDYFVPSFFLASGIVAFGSFLAGNSVVRLNTITLFTFLPLLASMLLFLGAFISHKILFAIRRDRYQKGFNFAFFGWFFSLIYLIFVPLQEGKPFWEQIDDVNVILSLIFLLTSSFYFLYYFRNFIVDRVGNVRKLFGKKHGKKTN